MSPIEIIRADGTFEQKELPLKGRRLLNWVSKAINAEVTDSVNLRDGRVMIVNDDGWETEGIDHGNGHIEIKCTKPKLPINAQATAIYRAICRVGTTHQIAGDVIIARDEDFA